ncbi:MAG TPA: glycosyltransferase family 39 protein, partial [Candidatus Eisenbacteria bacterium]
FFALGFMVIPDTPLLLCWFLAGRAAWRVAHRPDRGSAARLGLAFGFAALSKYVAVLLVLSTAGFLRLRTERRHLVPFLTAVAIGLLLMSPVVWWNAGHDWASFRYQFAGRHHGAHLDLGRLALYLGSQALVLSPLLMVLVAAAALESGPWHIGRGDPGEHLLWWLGAPTAGAFLAAAAITDFKPNWAAPGYAALVPLAVRGLWRWRARAPRPAAATGVATLATALACTALPVVHLIHPVIPLPAGADPTVDMRGWPAIAAHAEAAAMQVRSETRVTPLFAAGRYQLAARLEYYLRGHPDVVSLNPGRDAYDDWQDLHPLAGRNIVFITSDRFPTPPDELIRCDSARVVSRLTVASRREEQFHVTVWDVRGYRPGPPLPGIFLKRSRSRGG